MYTYRHGKHGDAFCLIATVDIKAGSLVFLIIFSTGFESRSVLFSVTEALAYFYPRKAHGGRFGPQ
jgi:hypothetical protein